MTPDEFSSEFDVLYNNVTSNQAPGLNGYEKSVFLTKAQHQLLDEAFNPRTDATNGGFDGTTKRQMDFSNLMEHKELTQLVSPVTKFDKRALVYELPNDVLYIVNEQLYITDSHSQTKAYTVIPLSNKEYERLMSKPYKYPLKEQAWRLFTNGNASVAPTPTRDKLIEIVGRFPTGTMVYEMRYVRKPNPIILENLTDLGVSIEGKYLVTPCELNDEMHHEILERAVTLAKITWQGSTMTQYGAAAASRKDQ